MNHLAHVIFSSYGNDSIALIQLAHERRLKNVLVLHSPTGWAGEGWDARVCQAELWVQSLGFTAARTQGETMQELLDRKKAWPRGGGGRFQFCTGSLKETPALDWMAKNDPDASAICMVGVRREESPNRATFPEHTHDSEIHGGRDLWAPLVRHSRLMRDALIAKTPIPLVQGKSKECWPCVNAGKNELKWLEESRIVEIEAMESRAGVNSKGNPRVMFSPARHGGAIGIRAVVADAQHGTSMLFASGCQSTWCGS